MEAYPNLTPNNISLTKLTLTSQVVATESKEVIEIYNVISRGLGVVVVRAEKVPSQTNAAVSPTSTDIKLSCVLSNTQFTPNTRWQKTRKSSKSSQTPIRSSKQVHDFHPPQYFTQNLSANPHYTSRPPSNRLRPPAPRIPTTREQRRSKGAPAPFLSIPFLPFLSFTPSALLPPHN